MEVMLVNGMNDTRDALCDINSAISQIMPDRVYMTTPIRPPAEPRVKPPTPESIFIAQEIIGQSITIFDSESGKSGVKSLGGLEDAILEISLRHPLRIEQARWIEEQFSGDCALDSLIKNNKVVKVPYNSSIYLLPVNFIRDA